MSRAAAAVIVVIVVGVITIGHTVPTVAAPSSAPTTVPIPVPEIAEHASDVVGLLRQTESRLADDRRVSEI